MLDHAENKAEQVAKLFLIDQRNKLLKAKVAAALLVLLNLVMVVFADFSGWGLVLSCILILLIEFKERILIFRITKGYFGETCYEAHQLMKFMQENSK